MNWEYQQIVNQLQTRYEISNKNLIKADSSRFPSPLKKYLQQTNLEDSSASYVKIKYYGGYRIEKYGDLKDFHGKGFFSLKERNYICDSYIKNKISFFRLREIKSEQDSRFNLKYFGIKNNFEYTAEDVEAYMLSKYVILAPWFPQYFALNGSISWDYISSKRSLARIQGKNEQMDFIFTFNEDGTLKSIESEKFALGDSMLKYTAYYSSYQNVENLKIPFSITVEVEERFDKYQLFSIDLSEIDYR